MSSKISSSSDMDDIYRLMQNFLTVGTYQFPHLHCIFGCTYLRIVGTIAALWFCQAHLEVTL